ncbi:Na+/H+ antiporter NhaA [Advenella incenata]
MKRYLPQKVVHFFNSEPASGIILMVTAVLGIWLANSAMADGYFSTLSSYVAGLSVLHWINDGLMAVFFLYVGLEVKRELLTGELSTNQKRLLPCMAAIAGVVAPALIYLAFNYDDPQQIRGWAVPAATDIAFALGVLALLGSRVPTSLKVFLTALAIIDDLIAIVVIALFYTAEIQSMYLALAAGTLIALVLLNRSNVVRTLPYAILGVFMWWFVLKSGIHATLAGVALALTLPMSGKNQDTNASPLLKWEHGLSPWVAFLIVPIFGFANAGVSFAGLSWSQLGHPVVLGIAAGLFLGKQLGIFGLVWLTVKFGLVKKPERASWPQIYGVAMLCGIGFTMSLFIGALAFTDPAVQDLAKIGVFAGSVLAAVLGYFILFFSAKENQ